MNHIMRFALFLLFSFSSLTSQTQDPKHLIKFEGKPLFINGINVAWNQFGGDVGNHHMWGTLYKPEWFENFFANCEKYGINCARLWIHTDGRANPEFDENGFVKGVDADFYPALDDIFLRAKNHGVLIMPCLWSFDMCKDFTKEAGEYAGRHEDLIMDSLKTRSYIDNVLIPLVKRYDKHCNLFAWEVINEPEWSITRKEDSIWTYKTDVTVPLKDMQRFTAMIAAAIHKNTSKMVTTGCGALKWSSEVAPAVGNWYGDKELQAVYPDKDAYLDFYQIHYYDYMNKDHFDPFDRNYPYEYWKMDKPCLIGEQPGNLHRDTLYTNTEKIQNAYDNHYAGHMFWSYNGYDGIGGFDDFKEECKTFFEAHKEEIQPFIPCKTLSATNLNFKAVPVKDKGKVKLNWQAENPKTIQYFDLEKSTDGVNFKWVRRFPANENKDPNYYYTDKQNGKVYYRLKSKETTGFDATSQVYVVE